MRHTMVSNALRYIEDHLDDKLGLNEISRALHYSKYHLHRNFTRTVGLTPHEYGKRRQLTEAAKLLVFSKKSILEIALISGYESQRAFAGIFKAMYKLAPAAFREAGWFYPLQLEMKLKAAPTLRGFSKDDIDFARPSDIGDWMELVRLAIDEYPRLEEEQYIKELHRYIADKRALILKDEGGVVGIMAIQPGNIDFFAVHPQYRSLGIARVFMDKLVDELLRGQEISLTTYRAGDKADTGYRNAYRRLGFAERELLMEYGYPAQRFVLLPSNHNH